MKVREIIDTVLKRPVDTYNGHMLLDPIEQPSQTTDVLAADDGDR